MKKALAGALRIGVPLALGLWLVYYFYRQLGMQQRAELFQAVRDAHWGWLLLSIGIGWCSHLSRAWRWRYLLGPLGHDVRLANAYHATMAGYFMNLLLPRAGEASRAMVLQRTEGVPFTKGFGTILAERAVDLIGLGLIGAITLLLQLDKLDLFRARIAAFRGADGAHANELPAWLPVVAVIVALALLAGAWAVWRRPAWRERLRLIVAGLWEGVRSVLHTPHRGWFILHTALIWTLYVAMFAVGFLAVDGMREVPLAGIMAGFVAGTLGIVLVQGGIGVYPAFVALIVGIHLAAPADGSLVRPDALALGWLLWAAQTAMIIVLGGLSLLLARGRKTPSAA
ncbi:MAG: lysylphosphatidylglycerol synthase transmembrane domain-containing protein [Flavobacteriales bacterium]|jgi:uncharacterized membrane protein YbhN (UPF0104 family)|nr:lysylphosphatidylglycerol synthase transmembrane domain-containing protein [Flavobacteriales bacterium]